MTLAYAPTGMGTNGTNILKSMYDGNISISDGPLIVQGFSTDGNNTVNEKSTIFFTLIFLTRTQVNQVKSA